MSLRQALLLSVALHALLLATSLPPRSIPQKAKELPLVARLVEARAQPVLKPAPPVVKRQSAPPIAAPAKPVPSTSEDVVEVAEPAIAERAATTEQQAVITEQISALTLDPGIVAKYRLEIISSAKQFRRYPPIARENGWQGRAEVRVSFEGARQPAVMISKSSGYALLDRQALETLSKALAPLPPLLLGRSFELDFPVVFSLED